MDKLNKNYKTNVLIIGLGLMGGSYAKALRRCGFTVNAITKEQNSIDYAIENGIINSGSTYLDRKMIKEADLVVFALYPADFINWIKENQYLFSPGTVITDVTGVKSSIVYEIQSVLRDDVEFIAAHPMAGREVYGVQNSDDGMFRGANYIITPTEKNTKEAIELSRELGTLLGFKNICILSPEEHDEIIGFVSQLTHCIAITLMTCNDIENLEKYTANSFKDLTRIAKINDAMWSELFMMNKDALLREMKLFEKKFASLRSMLEDGDIDGMREMMKQSTARRTEFDKNDSK